MQEEMIREIELARPRYIVSVAIGAFLGPRTPNPSNWFFTWANQYLEIRNLQRRRLGKYHFCRSNGLLFWEMFRQTVQQLGNYILIYEKKS